MAKICLDAGHYGKYNQSPANKAYYEAEMNWKLHNLLKKYLVQKGFEVIQTRSNQAADLELTARGKKAKGCDLFLSIHSNAVGSGVREDIDYPVAYVMMQDGSAATTYDKISQELGLKLAQTVGEVMGCKQSARVATRSLGSDRDGDGRLDADDEYYGVLYGARSVKVPGFILEHSFHTNTKMTNWLLSDSNLEKMAKAEADVIAAYFGMKKNADVLYRVQVGAYSVKANAEAMLAKLKKAGFDGFITTAKTQK